MPKKENKTIIIGHRGAAGEAPENTLGSFRLAVEQGAEALELDIHESADGALIVCHDATVDRTTNGHGSISRMTQEELQKLDAGGWFSPQYVGEKLPLLEEVFTLIPQDILINIEIKCAYSTRLEHRLLQLLQQYDRLQNVIISSFDHKILVRLKQAEPALKMGLLYVANFQNHRKMAESTGIEVFSLHPQYRLIEAEDVQDAVQNGLFVYPFTINEEEELRKALNDGVSGIITDFPGRLKTLRDVR
ncbi:glycerophosphoryl diester phosphodiesterase [Paenibacillus sp. 1_12]|uniref:glycerophosphodiester phosphodiesterase n=1 Tax=Paenibacillus sp. 1_12 TaxID=1566278 RepID=UPI0008E768EF|nr:glycerophosphodiester phosphodiesterase [Paenibacillus sp. 1_12]SFM13392.1 glycerophosphoryl diester phosphodiesterase [Paenibacillus sp. 1_12]